MTLICSRGMLSLPLTGLAKPGRHNKKDIIGFLDGHAKLFADSVTTKKITEDKEETPPIPKAAK
jgi:hypothetical protein